MMDLEFALPYSLKGARYVAGGVITQKAKTLTLSWYTRKAGVLFAVNAQKVADKRQYRSGLNTYLWIGEAVLCVTIAPTHAHLKLF